MARWHTEKTKRVESSRGKEIHPSINLPPPLRGEIYRVHTASTAACAAGRSGPCQSTTTTTTQEEGASPSSNGPPPHPPSSRALLGEGACAHRGCSPLTPPSLRYRLFPSPSPTLPHTRSLLIHPRAEERFSFFLSTRRLCDGREGGVKPSR
uniref:Uncharacterized protein n=1 Tax=Oryza nivara TaxID=4536 RepID=A0A0E0FLX4_ORYNI